MQTLELTGAFKLLLGILTILALALIVIVGGSIKYWKDKRKESKETPLWDMMVSDEEPKEWVSEAPLEEDEEP